MTNNNSEETGPRVGDRVWNQISGYGTVTYRDDEELDFVVKYDLWEFEVSEDLANVVKVDESKPQVYSATIMENKKAFKLTHESTDVIILHHEVKINSDLSIPMTTRVDLSKYYPGEHDAYIRRIIYDLGIVGVKANDLKSGEEHKISE